jgi:hypothetical protein
MTFTFDKRTVDWPFYADAQGVPHRHLISACNAGLCNRLLVAAGCLRLAKKLNRKFVLWWPVNGEDGVGCTFNELFVNTDLHIFDETDVHWLLDCCHTLKVYNNDEFNKIKLDDPEQILLMRLYYWPYFYNEAILTSRVHVDAAKELRAVLAGFKPVDEVMDRVRALQLPHGIIGVHVRRQAPFVSSTDQKFFMSLDQRFDKHRQPFYLATDYQPVEAAFKQRYGNLVITQPKKVWVDRNPNNASQARCSREGMIEALIDLYALAQCRYVVGTQRSTFSHVAAMLAGDPNETLVEV